MLGLHTCPFPLARHVALKVIPPHRWYVMTGWRDPKPNYWDVKLARRVLTRFFKRFDAHVLHLDLNYASPTCYIFLCFTGDKLPAWFNRKGFGGKWIVGDLGLLGYTNRL